MTKLSIHKLSGKKAPSEIRLFKTGVNESTKGDFIYNPERAEEIIASLNGIQPGIDIAHLSLSDSSNPDSYAYFGWYDLEAREDGLYATNIEWTEDGKRYVEEDKFRYFSPAFDTDENGEIVEFINFSLTNTPALKDIEPLILSRIENKHKRNSQMAKKATEETKELTQLQEGVEETVEEVIETVEEATNIVAALQEQLEMKQAEIESKMEEISALQQENESLRNELSQIRAEQEDKEKEELLEDVEDLEEKEELKKLSIESLRKLRTIRLSRKNVVDEKSDTEFKALSKRKPFEGKELSIKTSFGIDRESIVKLAEQAAKNYKR